jgi:hypothetical protein
MWRRMRSLNCGDGDVCAHELGGKQGAEKKLVDKRGTNDILEEAEGGSEEDMVVVVVGVSGLVVEAEDGMAVVVMEGKAGEVAQVGAALLLDHVHETAPLLLAPPGCPAVRKGVEVQGCDTFDVFA